MFRKEEIFYLIAAFLFGLALLLVVMQYLFGSPLIVTTQKQQQHWQIQSIDTMKYSRDMARSDLTDPNYTKEVNKQMSAIANTGANYVAIDTPYDDEFIPVLTQWVQAARAQGLHVWFRGNFSGWEGWFTYPPLTEQEHITAVKRFILNNSTLFQDGDIFTSCPECENGIHLNTGDPTAVANYRDFLVAEYAADKESFLAINKKVASNFFSMNADVARSVMDKATTQKLDGMVVIDHYVKTPEQLASQTAEIAQLSGGSIVLGEFGAPIPDLQGTMTEAQQEEWLKESLAQLAGVKALIGVNYWVDKGGSTALWRPDNTPKPAVAVLTQYYQ